jgi:tRNA G18 (ribose-2'-O)-methylase SpoU
MLPVLPQPIDVDASDSRLDIFRGIRDRDLRGGLGLHAIESERVVRRFLAASIRRRTHPIPPIIEPYALLATREAIDRLGVILTAFPSLALFRCINEQALHEVTGYTMHSGAIALGVRHDDASIATLTACLAREESRAFASEHISRDVLVAFDGITQTDNVGAIFRNAASFGARGAILSPTTSDPFLRKTMRVSMGRALNIPWSRARIDEWPICLDRLRREQGYTILAAEDTADAVPLSTFAPPPKALVVFGAEQAGVSAAVLDLADAVVRIPMSDLAGALSDDPPSLNVSIASAVVLHHLLSSH